MAETILAQCGYCQKRFQVRPEQLNRPVRCPHCKTLVKIPAPTDAGRAATEVLKDTLADKEQIQKRRLAPPPPVGLRSKNVAVVWMVLLAAAMIGLAVGLYFVFGRERADEEAEASASSGFRQVGTAQAPATGAVPAATALGGPTPMTVTPLPPPKPGEAAPPEPIVVKIERLLIGYKDETVTYAVGRLTNTTGETFKTLKVAITIADSKDNPVGEATAVLLNVPPKTTVPLVASWHHTEGMRGNRWALAYYQISPPGVPQDLPPLVAKDPWPVRDPNAMAPTGNVKVLVVNRGVLPVTTMEAMAILINSEGKIVGATRTVVTKEIKPNASEEVMVPWDHCAGSLVASAEVWIQPTF